MIKLPAHLLETYDNIPLDNSKGSCILYKVIPDNRKDEEFYLSSHLIVFV